MLFMIPKMARRILISSSRTILSITSMNSRPCIAQMQRNSGNHGICSKSDLTTPKIYTKTGDKGTSVTIAGDRRRKDDDIFEALGTTDELSSAIGLAREFCTDSHHGIGQQLEEIQCILQDAGSSIATPLNLASSKQISITKFDASAVDILEQWIDEYTGQLPPLRNFILPSGGKTSSCLHLARSICRRAERRLIPLVSSEQVDPVVGRYFNRLSDYLFTIARFAAQCDGQQETIYRKIRQKDQTK